MEFSKRCSHDDVIKWNYFPRYWPFVREATGHRWISLAKTSDAALWCFLWSALEQTVKQTAETPAIWDTMAFIMTSLLCCVHRAVNRGFELVLITGNAFQVWQTISCEKWLNKRFHEKHIQHLYCKAILVNTYECQWIHFSTTSGPLY